MNAQVVSIGTLIDSINAWDFNYLERYVATKYPHIRNTGQGIEEYKRFIIVSMTSASPRIPCKMVDEVWHAHILHSKDYLSFCRTLGVDYIHHNPSEAGSDDASLSHEYRLTKEAYQRIFGEMPSPEFWGGASSADCNGDCYGHGGCSKDCKSDDQPNIFASRQSTWPSASANSVA